jgi:acid phosphatase (class A)
MVHSIDKIKHQDTGDQYQSLVDRSLSKPNSSLNKYIRLGLIHELPLPPKNSDPIVAEEIEFMHKMLSQASEEQIQFAKNVHDLKSNYRLWSIFANKLTGEDYDASYFNDIADQTDGLINYVKLQFNRPRPYVLAEAMGRPFEINVDKRYSTASYPSGHSCEAYMFGMIMARKHKKYANLFHKFAQKLANSRIIAGVHFPTDIIGGKILASQIIDNNLCTYR